jgi:hypothetical protein
MVVGWTVANTDAAELISIYFNLRLVLQVLLPQQVRTGALTLSCLARLSA